MGGGIIKFELLETVKEAKAGMQIAMRETQKLADEMSEVLTNVLNYSDTDRYSMLAAKAQWTREYTEILKSHCQAVAHSLAAISFKLSLAETKVDKQNKIKK